MVDYAWPSVVRLTVIGIEVRAIAFECFAINFVVIGDYPDHDGSASPVGDDVKARENFLYTAVDGVHVHFES